MTGRFSIALLLWSLALSAWPQGPDWITEDAFVKAVMDHHPVARQAEFTERAAQAKQQAARGAFDPVVSGGEKGKVWDGSRYYSLTEANLVLPTASPVDVVIGRDEASGNRLDASRYLPEGGQWRAGVAFDLGQGLITDARRTALRQAEVAVELGSAARQLMELDLRLSAQQTFWAWWKAEAALDLSSEAVLLAETQRDQVDRAVAEGARAAIDTVEVRLILARREADRAAAAAKALRARAKVEAMLWEGGQPVALAANARPMVPTLEGPIASDPFISTALRQAVTVPDETALRHPAVVEVEGQWALQRYTVRLARQGLRPTIQGRVDLLTGLDAGVNPSDAGLLSPPDWNGFDPSERQATSLKVSMPLFLRKARGEVAYAEAELEKRHQKRLDLSRKWQVEFAAVKAALPAQVAAAEAAASAARQSRVLLDAERTRWQAGESDLFRVNAREAAWVKARKEAIDRQYEAQVAVREFGWWRADS